MKAIILARVSSAEQLENLSIPAQIERARDYANKKGFEITDEFQFDESSTSDRRKKFEEVIQQIQKSKEKTALIVETVDRLQRSFKESTLLDDLRKNGKLDIHFIRENLVITDSSNSSEIQRWDLAVFVAKSYVLQLSDNVRRSINQKIKNGEFPSKAPVGYINVNEKGKNTIVPDPQKSELIKKLFQLYAEQKYSIRSLPLAMKDLGLVSRYGNELSTSQVEHILKNPFYYGVMRIKGEEHPHQYEPLISENLFRQCEKVRKGWSKKPIKYASKLFALRGIITCEICGCVITGEQQGIYTYYSCTNYRNKHKRIYIREEDLLLPITQKLEELKITEQQAQEIATGIKILSQTQSASDGSAREILLAEKTKTEHRISRLLDLLLDGEILKNEYDIKLDSMKQRKAELEAKIQEIATPKENIEITAEKIMAVAKHASTLFKNSEPREKRLLLEQLLQNCTLNGRKLTINLKEPFNLLVEMKNMKYIKHHQYADGVLLWQGR